VYDKIPEIQKILFPDLPQTLGEASKNNFLEIPPEGFRGKKGSFVVHPKLFKVLKTKRETIKLISRFC